MSGQPVGALPDAAAELLAYYAVTAAERHELPGATLLRSPGTPLIGANAAYPTSPEGIVAARRWLASRQLPVLVASTESVAGARRELSLAVGTYRPRPVPSAVVVEQISRLHLASWAAVLTEAWEVPDWGALLARSLSAALESHEHTLLMAYDDGPAGVLLVLQGRAHLWGARRQEVLLPLLNAAADVSATGTVRTSCPPEHPLRDSLERAARLDYWRPA